LVFVATSSLGPVPLLAFPTRSPVPTLATPNRNWELGLTDPGARANLHGAQPIRVAALPIAAAAGLVFSGFSLLEFPSLHET
jgi:hypothetical protein